MIQIMLAISLVGVAIAATIQAGRAPAQDIAVANLAAQVNQLVTKARQLYGGDYADLHQQSAYLHKWLPAEHYIEREGVWLPFDQHTGAVLTVVNWDDVSGIGFAADPIRDGMSGSEGFLIAITGLDKAECVRLARILTYSDIWLNSRHIMRDNEHLISVRRLGLFCRGDRNVFVSTW